LAARDNAQACIQTQENPQRPLEVRVEMLCIRWGFLTRAAVNTDYFQDGRSRANGRRPPRAPATPDGAA
jgi:hypothetical protein